MLLNEELEFEDFYYYLHQKYSSTDFEKKRIVTVQLNNDRVKNKSYEVDKFDIYKYSGQLDTYITPNQFIGYKRNNKTLWQLNNLYVDLDIEKHGLNVSQVYMQILAMIKDNEIPAPTLIVMSGRGLHLYWNIGSYAPTSRNKKLWLDVNTALAEKLKMFGVDKAVSKDVTRVLRVVGTINSRNGKVCELWSVNDVTYKLDFLVKEYCNLKYSSKRKSHKKGNKKKKENSNLKEVKTFYTLHKDRLKDLLKLIELRGNDIYKHRNQFLFLIAYYRSVTKKDIEINELILYLQTINVNLVVPRYDRAISKNDIETICNSAFRYKKSYFEFREKLKEGTEAKKSSEDKEIDEETDGVLRYKSETLIEMLEITKKEQEQMLTIIDDEVHSKRKNDKRKLNRRNEEGLTKREQNKKDTYESIQALKSKGLTQKEISEQMNVSLKTVKRHWRQII